MNKQENSITALREEMVKLLIKDDAAPVFTFIISDDGKKGTKVRINLVRNFFQEINDNDYKEFKQMIYTSLEELDNLRKNHENNN